MRVLVSLVFLISCGLMVSEQVAFAEDVDGQKAVLITGASSGIGRATAEKLAAEGYFVYAGARKAGDIEALNKIDNIMAVRLDVTVQEEIDAAVELVESEGRGLWGIVNNAGINIIDPLIEVANSPNIVILYIDDLGYGDVGSYGAVGVNTPNIDRLAANGVRFTDAHSTAATCTPSRYSLLSGEHGFRVEADILEGDAPLLIRPGKPTIATLLKRAGYATGVVGKWHLGLGDGNLDWNGDISPGPRDIGFDYAFLLPATGDRVPAVYVENRKVVDLEPTDPITISYTGRVGDRPTGYDNPELLRFEADPQHSDTIINGVSRIGHMDGGKSALWVDEEFPDVFTDKAVAFMRAHQDVPFFLFHSFHDIHVPRLPNARFEGKSTMGPRGDAIAQVDWMVGEIVSELESLGIADNTLVIFTSDNGPVLNDGYADQSVKLIGEHRPAGKFRGGKYSAYEAGTRVPTIVYWPGSVEASISHALVSQIDIYASLAGLVGQDIVDRAAIDSRNHIDAWLGRSDRSRDYLLEESVGSLALRKGNWKYISPYEGLGGLEWVADDKNIEGGFTTGPQLYNLTSDPGEQVNLSDQYPDLVAELHAESLRIVADTYR